MCRNAFSCLTFFQEKYEDENENSSEKANINNNETTIVSTGGSNAQPSQIFHVSVEYEEPPKSKIKTELMQNARKRRMVTKDTSEQYVQPSSSTPKQTPTIIIDDKSQDHEIKSSEPEEPFEKRPRLEESKKPDKFEIFGLFIANEMRSLQNLSLQNKLKRKILECILEMNEQDSEQQS